MADVYNIGQQQWYHYDDEVVSYLTEGEVLGSARQRNGYIFCYMHRYHSAVSYLVLLSPYAKFACRAPLPAFVVSWDTNVLETKIFGVDVKVELQIYYQFDFVKHSQCLGNYSLCSCDRFHLLKQTCTTHHAQHITHHASCTTHHTSCTTHHTFS